MTLKEASEQFCISIDKLNVYEKHGLLVQKTLVNGIPDYTEEELSEKVGIIHALSEAGMDMNTLKSYLLFGKKMEGKKDQIRILRKQRYQLLEEIHRKQQSLDRLDYMIDEIRKGGV